MQLKVAQYSTHSAPGCVSILVCMLSNTDSGQGTNWPPTRPGKSPILWSNPAEKDKTKSHRPC